MVNWLHRFKAFFPKKSDTDVALDERKGIRLGFFALLFGFGGFLLWAAWAPLDEGVPLTGVVAVESKKKTIQSLTGGTVKKIGVEDGQEVKEGDILVKLDDTKIRADRDITRNDYFTNLSVQSRLNAEKMGSHKLFFPDELVKNAAAPSASDAMALQTRLFNSRQTSLNSEIEITNEGIAGVEEQVKGLEALERSKEQQLGLLTQEVDGLRELAHEGFVPRSKLFEVERNIATLQGSRSDDIANIAHARSNIAELKLKKLKISQDYQKEVELQLTDIQKNVSSLRDRLTQLDEELERTDIKSPTSGTVVGLAVHTLGGVIGSGAKIMDIVPKGDALIVEAQIPPHLINHVHSGLPADVHFTALDVHKTPIVTGVLATVSADSIEDPAGRIPPYYSASVKVSVSEMKKLGDQPIRPGMPVEVIIKTGERTFLTYLIKPLFDRFSSSLTEK